jgi:hypothetical protein
MSIMNIKRVTCASAVALAVGAAVLTAAAPVAGALPGPAAISDSAGTLVGRAAPVARAAHRLGPPPPPPGLAWHDIDQARWAHQPFNYYGNWVTPIFNPDGNNWGF